MTTEIVGIVFAKGVPALLVLLGFSAWVGNTFLESLLGISHISGTAGILMMVVGVGIYVFEKLFGL